MIFFTGDVNFTDWFFNVGFGIGTRIEKGFNPLKYLDRKVGDLWIGNFEGVASPISANSGIYSKAFRINPKALLGIHHFDIYGFANNHAMEHGADAYMETIKALESYGSRVFGSDANHSIEFIYQGRKCSITGACLRIEDSKYSPLYWYNPEYNEIEKEISVLPKDAFKIFYVHWGNEYINRPSVFQKKLAHWLIDLGFDLIIGMHSHVLQGYEIYKGKRVYYSLGNCVFDMPSEQCRIGALVGLDFINGNPVYWEQYLHIDNECCPHVVDESEIPSVWRFSHLNKCLMKNDNSESYHNEIKRGYKIYQKANRKQLLASAFFHPSSFSCVLMDFIKRKLNR